MLQLNSEFFCEEKRDDEIINAFSYLNHISQYLIAKECFINRDNNNLKNNIYQFRINNMHTFQSKKDLLSY
jgi:hypothetical protein